jgi:phage tail-like protein
MAVERSTPYPNFNFVVDFNIFGDPGSFQAGFQEISGIGLEVTVAEYRNGNEPLNRVRKITGMYKATDVTLKRGLVGSLNIFNWIRQTREGTLSGQQRATVTIRLMNEAHTEAVMTFLLHGAVPSKYTGATLNAKGGTDVAMEELVLACEDLIIE